MDPFIITTAGWLCDEPFVTTTSDGQPMVKLQFAVGAPPRPPGGISAARCCTVAASGALASQVAEQQLHEGEHVIVRARDLTTETWLTDDGQPRSIAVLRAHAITPSLMSGPVDDEPSRPGPHPGRHPGRRPADNESEAQ